MSTTIITGTRAVVSRFRNAFWAVALLSAVLNVLMLGGSIYMMMVYDSVLPSHSLPTLFGLFVMIVIVYIFQALFDRMRQRMLSDIGETLDRELAPHVQYVMSETVLRGGRRAGDGLIAMRDLDSVRSWLSGSGPAALIDLPWILLFLIVVAFLHPLLMVTTLVGAIIMLGLTWLTDATTRKPMQKLSQIVSIRNELAENNLRHVEMLVALGMRQRMQDRWAQVNRYYLSANAHLSNSSGTIGGISKTFRMLLQSILLTVGALLVLDGKASGGIIFAGNMLCGRALAPIDSAIAQWRSFAAARSGWARLQLLFEKVPPAEEAGVILPPPTKSLALQQVFAAPQGTQTLTLSGINFTLKAGEALGVIGPSASGKTTLARVMTGVWQPVRGAVRLDGATLDQWDRERLGSFIGYLPQSVELMEGTVAENIARFDPDLDSTKVIAAARAAGVHELIIRLPNGYETDVGSEGAGLSAGQRQRIGLARALYDDPFLVVLDEPNSNLDGDGEAALGHAIAGVRARGGIAVVIAHRPSALAQVSHVLFMREGRAEQFGLRDEVLRAVSRQPERVTNGKTPAPKPDETLAATGDGKPDESAKDPALNNENDVNGQEV
ncbi:ATP-binding cassette subfamily C protein [Novosphingobium sp. SG751A]|uniref:type I secretion system permease/ATPase n=1 Tax=Novosphingobium sp. SG751A TaxID=2587000 RepID=UPI001551D4A3|nr:type I secretion system permease/ATPase [Novosphingobium sp. SG751A]NOW45590.1 ATP-binding cassette subfamily C protein [Novosphingobium sp. SG751A]